VQACLRFMGRGFRAPVLSLAVKDVSFGRCLEPCASHTVPPRYRGGSHIAHIDPSSSLAGPPHAAQAGARPSLCLRLRPGPMQPVFSCTPRPLSASICT
jgi:hypothetical protein